MNKIKKYWKEILLVFLCLCFLHKCTQSCNRQREINNVNIEINSRDSVITVLNDSIKLLNTEIQVYEEKISGLNNALNIQEEANKRISEAKKNISVTVQENKKRR